MGDQPADPDLDNVDDLDEFDDLDDEEFLAAIEAEDREAAVLLIEFLGNDLPDAVSELQRTEANQALRAGVHSGAWPYDWFARSPSG